MNARTHEPTTKEHRLDLHAEYVAQSSAGYDASLTLHPREVQALATRLRAISAIAAVLQAGDSLDVCVLGDYMRGGLIEAIDVMSGDAQGVLSVAHDRATKNAAKGITA
ncbi:hypothetical protein [Hydrogenophaga atypica]|uniref:Uncharacterized protein n=1 Tax=Hydrogenophaga atypica TaxID=249409 RepID=A0ABW2QTP0_9BURK